MCEDPQHYYSPVSSPTKMTWALAPTSGIKYNFYGRIGGCPGTSVGSYDYRTYGGAGVTIGGLVTGGLIGSGLMQPKADVVAIAPATRNGTAALRTIVPSSITPNTV